MSQKRNLFVVGISHGSADADLIGLCGFNEDEASALESEIIAAYFDEAIVLSTCNRVEFYLAKNGEFNAAQIPEMIKRIFEISGKSCGLNFLEKAYVKSGNACVEHLFSVASGLDSQMTGETEIFGQVKLAYARALKSGHSAITLNKLFQKASQCGKWVRSNTEIGNGKISIGSVSASLASRIFKDIKEAQILVIGSGSAGSLVSEALSIRGAKNICITSRTFEKAENLARTISANTLPLEEALNLLENFDVIICAAATKNAFITRENISKALQKRRNKPIFLIDLGVPRNCESACENLENLYLYNLDDLSAIAAENLKARRAEIEFAQTEIKRRAKNLSQNSAFD